MWARAAKRLTATLASRVRRQKVGAQSGATTSNNTSKMQSEALPRAPHRRVIVLNVSLSR
eukprot:169430-Pyramimonas_sp.AAC.2